MRIALGACMPTLKLCEEFLENGKLKISWRTSDTDVWNFVLRYVKTLGGKYVPDDKAWIIKKKSISDFQRMKDALQADGIQIVPADIHVLKKNSDLVHLESKWGLIKIKTSKPIPITDGQKYVLAGLFKCYPSYVNELFFMLAKSDVKSNKNLTPSFSDHNVCNLSKQEANWMLRCLNTLNNYEGDRFVDYHEYIESKEWEEKSKKAKERAGNRCQVCNRSSQEVSLHTHHRTYDRIGREADSDLTVLCEDCHRLFELNSSYRPAKRKS